MQMQYEIRRKMLLGRYHYWFKNSWYSVNDLLKFTDISKNLLTSRLNHLRRLRGENYTIQQLLNRPTGKPAHVLSQEKTEFMIEAVNREDAFFKLSKTWPVGSLSSQIV